MSRTKPGDGRVVWTEEMVKIMVECYATDGPVRLAKRLGKSLPSVLWKAKLLGLSKNQKGRWTTEKLQALKERYPTEGGHRLADEFGIPVDIVWSKASVLGLHTNAGIVDLGNRKAANNRSSNIHYFDQWTPNSAYAFGFLLADGSIDKEERRLRVSVVTKDEAILLFLQKEFGGGRIDRRQGGIDSRGSTYQPRSRLTVCSKILIEKLIALGMKPRKTFNDDVFPQVPKSFMGHFLRGVLDGDGCVHVTERGHCQVTIVGSPRFITGLRDILVYLLGIGKNKVQVHTGKLASWAMVTWSARADLKKFYAFAYPPGFGFCLERKRRVLYDWLNAKPEQIN